MGRHPFPLTMNLTSARQNSMIPERRQDADVPLVEADRGMLENAANHSPLAPLGDGTRHLLLRMFADPYVLERPERSELIDGLREAVSRHPRASELRVLFGMALCVD